MEDERLYDSGEKENTTGTAKCPGCGAELEFDPESSSLKCPFCGYSEKVDLKNDCKENDLEKLFEDASNSWGSETHVFICNNCGAKEILNKNEIAKNCSYCGTTNVIEKEEISGLKPDSVVPFKIAHDNAVELVKKWAKKKFYAPRKFKKEMKPEDISGSYSPCFTFDINTRSFYSGKLGKHYTQSVTRNGKTTTVTKTRYFYIKGTIDKFFDDITIHASDRLSQKNLNKLKGFDTNRAERYKDTFLHGFTAQAADRGGKDCFNDAKKIMNIEIRKAILRRYTYDTIEYLDIKTNTSDETYKYCLLPIWFGHYTYKNVLYNFFVNGENGTVTGKTPKSALKIILTIGVIALIIGFFILLAYLGE